MTTDTDDQVGSAVAAYFDALVASDADAFVALFAADATMHDPVGTLVHEGHVGVARFHKGLQKAWSTFSMSVDEVYARGHSAAVRWSAEGTSASGKRITFQGIDVFHVDKDGRIAQLEGYWDLEGVIAQM